MVCLAQLIGDILDFINLFTNNLCYALVKEFKLDVFLVYTSDSQTFHAKDYLIKHLTIQKLPYKIFIFQAPTGPVKNKTRSKRGL